MIRRIVVTGRVQGVWFRGWAIEQAAALGLNGWVRNRRDGSVEILAEGTEVAIAELIRLCHDGPPSARVEQLKVDEADEAVPVGFGQRPTL